MVTNPLMNYKGVNAGTKTAGSIMKECPSAMMRIIGVASDKFGESEAREILRQCDEFSEKVHTENPTSLTYPSIVVRMKF